MIKKNYIFHREQQFLFPISLLDTRNMVCICISSSLLTVCKIAHPYEHWMVTGSKESCVFPIVQIWSSWTSHLSLLNWHSLHNVQSLGTSPLTHCNQAFRTSLHWSSKKNKRGAPHHGLEYHSSKFHQSTSL